MAIKQDLLNQHILAACRVLGLIEKLVTAPLWKVIEQPGMSILEMSKYYTVVRDKFQEWSNDSTSIIDGTATLFHDFDLVSKDSVYLNLVQPFQNSLCVELCQKIFKELKPKWERWFAEHLPGGIYHQSSMRDNLVSDTKSVPRTNIIAERDFAQLDRFLKHAPNSNIKFLESKIACSNNKTTEYLAAVPEAEKNMLISAVRKDVSKQRMLETSQKKNLLEAKIKILNEKRAAVSKKQEKQQQQKQQLLEDLQKIGGLWSSKDQVESELAKRPLREHKIVLKTQLSSRRKLLNQSHQNMTLFQFSQNKKQYDINR